MRGPDRPEEQYCGDNCGDEIVGARDETRIVKLRSVEIRTVMKVRWWGQVLEMTARIQELGSVVTQPIVERGLWGLEMITRIVRMRSVEIRTIMRMRWWGQMLEMIARIQELRSIVVQPIVEMGLWGQRW